ncbi:peptide-N-glycosidase F-related protein [Hymenobacter monticola]|uniref:T9SS type A sorting domain-containing protein n=1 Tax=Hymenobacter monticola TaxID=1705399 RepID=A0ABY4AY68_9BACT|nr:peptide-N-glycosidase F-related protein [Hymenobacter monticola]UOE31827.1 T9SS type A sorting domain-containing protein [Hymenobacter monticola]
MLKRLRILVLLLLAGLALAEHAQAAPGDTTRVTIFNQRKLTHYGFYDTTAVMPAAGRRYRKVLMHYILGRYPCPPGTQYCGSWDYTTRLTLMPQAHDSVEMARIMTPYATDWLTRNKTHDYVVDVTDYAPLLVGNPGFRFDYQGYSWGFTVTVRLDFIEGTPPQDPIDVRNVYDGTFAYGRTSDPIEAHLPARTLVAPSAGTIALKSLISGHGSDPANCAEFCRKFYQLLINNQWTSTTSLWRDDCGKNEVYPQTGTWVYDRGNWCPGAVVRRIVQPLNGLTTPGQPFSLDINMQGYVANNQTSASAQYIWSSQLVTAGAINFRTDASLDEIIAPNSNENYVRENPICGGPQVRLRNLGSNPLTAVTIAYRVKGRGPTQTYNWTGSLAYGRDTLVALPPLSTLMNNTTGGRFQAWTTTPNGSRDQNAYNDTLTTRFAPSIQLPGSITVNMVTNNARNGLYNETSWQIVDVAGNVVGQRVNAAASTTYNDNVRLTPGCYSLRLTDLGCDGFSWWASPATVGSMRILNSAGSVLNTINGDFGCEYTLNFQVAGPLASAANQKLLNALDVYPNPSHDGRFTFDLNLPSTQDVQLHVVDALGRRVWARALPQVKATVQQMALDGVAPGVYALEVRLADGTTLNRRLVID